MGVLTAKQALLPSGWGQDVVITVDDMGTIVDVAVNGAPDDASDRTASSVEAVSVDILIPGMTNLHSHAFQRAMAGQGEVMGSPDDSFWTWREVMYSLALSLSPDDLSVVARQLAIECLKGGYTGICEFHYQHHNLDGSPFDDIAEMSTAVVSAYRTAGLAVTHLPVLYATSGFDGGALSDRQRRFKTDPASILNIIERTRQNFSDDLDVIVGIAPHSLRAAPLSMIDEAVAGLHNDNDQAPVHIHISEQVKEVEDCIAATGKRPIQLLFDHGKNGVPIDHRWNLIHATHPDAAEVAEMAESGCCVGLCPATEGNLGDGIFPVPSYRDQGGIWGIGSDSHVARDAMEELRLLEYGQRLIHRRRNIIASPETPSVGGTLWREALEGGARASGRQTGAIAVGCRADFMGLRGDHLDMASAQGDAILDRLIFSGINRVVDNVWVGGQKVISDGQTKKRKQKYQKKKKKKKKKK